MKTNRLIAIALATLCSVLVVVPPVASPVQAAANLQTTKSAPGQLLAGDPLSYSITASNSGAGADPLYNLTFRDVLPLGVTYAANSTAPAEAGEPQVIVNQVPDTNPGALVGDTIPQTTLIWSNVTDLQANDDFTVSFRVDVDSTGDPVRNDVHVIGAQISNTGESYGGVDPRRLPTFNAKGEPTNVGPTIITDSSDAVTTTLTALQIEKSEPSPEGELLRGVHDETTTFTLTVDVTDLAPVSGITVTDYLPAALEFLECGTVDNSAPNTEEYSGSGRLTTGNGGSNCLTPDTVETVENPPADGTTTYPAGVYTKVTWTLPTLVAGTNVPYVITYAAGIPLFENRPFTGTVPTPASREQGSNLDNNTGPSTRELARSERAVTNIARASGTFTDGNLLEPGVPSADVADDDRLSRSVEDLRVRKTIVQPTDDLFSSGAEAEFLVYVQTSEYMSASDVVLTDTVPNGLCPMPQNGFTYQVNDPACLVPRDPSPPFASVDLITSGTGGYTTVFEPIPVGALPASGEFQAVYRAFMRGSYEGGSLNGRPTVSGDSFTNTINATGTTTGIPEIGTAEGFDPEIGDPLDGVEDGSSATLATTSLGLSKELLPRNVSPRLDGDPLLPLAQRCPAQNTGEPGVTTDQYISADATPIAADVDELGFRLGDQICFRLRVDFDEATFSRNAVVTDFVPLGTKYVNGTIRAVAGVNTVPFATPNLPDPVTDPLVDGPITFNLGTSDANGDLYVNKGGVFEVVFAVEVVEVPLNDNAVITGNLMKMRTENSLGQAQSFRDEANFGIVPPPPVQVVKGVASVNGDPVPENPANSDIDGVQVRQADLVTFRIDLTNLGTASDFNEFSVRELDVLDVLPSQVSCSAISNIENFGPASVGECLNPGQSSASTTNPYTNTTSTSVIRWFFEIAPGDDPDDYGLFPGDEVAGTPPVTESVTYSMRIPTPTSVSTRFDNDAGLRRYGGFTNLENVVASGYVPQNNIDPSLNPVANTPEARDDSWVETPGPEVSKFVTSWIDETNNTISDATPAPTTALPVVGERAQAVIGEYVTYRYFVDIPAQTTVIGATLADTLPANLALDPAPPAPVVSPSLTFYPNAESATTASVPAGVSFDSATGTVDFTGGATPGEYRNITATDQRFEVLLTARVTASGLLSEEEPSRVNTVRFRSLDATLSPLPVVSDTATVDIRQPLPNIDKVSDVPAGDVVTGGQTVTYTLTATTDATRPPLHDGFIEDCVPAGLESVALVSPGPNDLVRPGPVADCSSGETYVRFALGTIQPGVANAVSRQYTAVVSLSSVGGAEYVNTAELTGSSLQTGNTVPGQDDPNEGVYSDTSTAEITVAGAGVFAKTVSPGTARIGERVDYGLQITVPPNTNFYQAAVLDKLPLGLADVTLDSCQVSIGGGPRVDCTASSTITLSPLGPSPAPDGSGILYGLYFGDVLFNTAERQVFVSYSARVDDVPANIAGRRLTNVAQTNWDLENFDDEVVDDPTYDWQQQGQQKQATFEIIEPDVVVSKSASDDTPEPGEEFTYTLTVLNQGTSEAYNVHIVDTLPPGVEIVLAAGVSPSIPGVYDAAGRTITWDAGMTVIPAGESRTLTYRAKLAPSPAIGVGSNFTNSATVTNFESLASGGRVDVGNTTTETVAPQFPQLVIDKTVVDTPPAYIDQAVTWQVRVTNTGGGSAFSVDVADVLPANWTYVAGSSTLGTPGTPIADPTQIIAGTRVRLAWDDLGTLAPDASLVVRFQAIPRIGVVSAPWNGSATPQINDAAAQAIDNSLAGGNLDGRYEAEDSASTTVDRVDLEITKASTGQAIAGSNFSWSIVVRNFGPDTAVGPFVVTDTIPTLPAGVTFASASGTGWTCTPATGPVTPPATGDVTCRRALPDDTLASGAQFPAITFTVRIPSTTPDGTLISNTASVGGQKTYERPTDLANNTATDTDTIITRANLRIVKTLVTPPGLIAGTDSTYNLAITNLGPSTSRATVAQPIVVRDTLPPTVSFVSATDTAATPTFTCTHDGATTGGVVTCNRTTDMLLNASSNIRVVVRVPSGLTGSLTNTGAVTPAITTDPTPGNNTSTITNPIVERADLGIAKTALGPNVPGEPTTYRLSVTNNGPGDATVRIQDALPAGLMYRSFSNVTGTWTCAASVAPDPVPGFRCDLTGKLAFTPSPLNAVTVDVVVDTAASVTGTVVNTAVVSSTAQDTNPDNNTATAPLTFVGVADLALAKTSSGTALPGGPITWTINVANLGPSDSQGPIVVRDQLPDGVIGAVTATGTGWSCTTSATLLVECTRATLLASGANSDIALTAVADPTTGKPNPIVNSATVFPTSLESNDPNDPKTANNTDTDTVTLADPAVTLAKGVSNTTPQPGDRFTYTMTLTNAAGAAPAYNLQISDALPQGISFVSSPDGDFTPSGSGCATGSEGTVNWTVDGPLAPDTSTTVSFVAELCTSASIDRAPITNTATLDSFESLASGGRAYPGNSDIADVTPRFPTIIAAKVALGDNPTYIDDEFAWQITVTNTGDGDAKTVDVQDILPLNWVYVDGSTTVVAPSGTTTPVPTSSVGPGGEVALAWTNVGSLRPGQSLTVSFRSIPLLEVATDPGVGSDQEQRNTAFARATDNSDANGNGDGPYVAGPVFADAFIHSADLEIIKSNAPTPAIAGEEYTWSIVVQNNAGDTAVGPFRVVDPLPVLTPDPLRFVSAGGAGWTCTEAAGTVSCTRLDPDETLAAGDGFEPISITVAIPADFVSNDPDTGAVIDGPIVNAATVTARTYDPDTANNRDEVQTSVGGEADLVIDKKHTQTDIIAGRPVTYTFDVSNNGPSTARADVVIVDTLPEDLLFVSAPAATAVPWGCVFFDSNTATSGGGTVTCTLRNAAGPIDLLADAAAPQLSIVTQVLPSADPGVAIVNGATVTSSTPDPVTGNNADTDSITPRALSDLAISKVLLDPADFTAGEEATFRLAVTNFGPSDAESIIRVIDDLPDGLTYRRATNVTRDWNCTSPDDDVVTCDLVGGLALGGTAAVDITVFVSPTLLGNVENIAEVQSLTTTDPIDDNNTDNEIVGLGTEADLGIVKTSVGEEFRAGENVTWELVVTNEGPSDSQPNIVVTDTLPDSLTYDDATGDGWTCVAAPSGLAGFGDTVTCTRDAVLPALDPNDATVSNIAPTITLEATISPDAGPSQIFNTAVVSGVTEDNNSDNDTSTDSVNVIDVADLAIVKTPGTQTVRAGENATFTLTVTNSGPSTADNVAVIDDLPSGMTVVSAAGTNWTCTTPTAIRVSCTRPTLLPGVAEAITVVAKVGSGVPDATTLVNESAVSASTTDDDPTNNDDSADVVVQARADLGITKVHPVSPDPVLAGTNLEFTIDVINNGPSDAVAPVTVTDTLPVGFNYLSVRGPWRCTPTTADPQVIECTHLGGGLVSGQRAGSLLMLVAIDATADSGVYTNTATVASPTVDPVPGNDTATDDVNVGTVADVSIVKSHDPDQVRIGENLTFTLAVSNAGPSEARDVVVTDTLPAELTLVSVTGAVDPSTWSCTTVGQAIECLLAAPLPPMTDAEDIIVTALVEPEAFPSISNTADVVSSTSDSDTDNNSSTDVVDVPRLVDLFISKTHAEPVAVGQPIVYTLTVGNNGPIDDDAVITVTDPIPSGLRVTEATSDTADCSSDDGLVTCTKDDGLAVGETFTITVTADVLPGAYPSVTNTAEVSSPTDDVDPSNNAASDSAVVPPLVDLAITKTHAEPVQVGGQITYTVTVRNNGPTPDPGPVRMLDTLPGSLTPVSASADGMTCVVTGQTVACQALAPLGVNAELVITIVADVGPAAYPSVANTAIVTTPGCSVGPAAGPDTPCPDTDLTNNEATDVATVTPLIRLGVVKTLSSLEAANATWNIVVTNLGSNATVDPIRMSDNLPNTLIYVSANGDGWVCTNIGQTVGCTYSAALAPGASAPPISIVTIVNAPAGTSITNIATVDGGGPDVPEVTDNGNVIAPVLPPLPNTGGGPGILLQWAPLMVLLGLAMVFISNRRRQDPLAA